MNRVHYWLELVFDMNTTDKPKRVPNPHGNPDFKPKWRHKTAVMRLPEEFQGELFTIARLLDEGLITTNDIERFVLELRKDAILDEVKASLA